MQVANAATLRLKAVVEADPGALVRVLQLFQARNLIPRSVASERLGDEYLQIQIELPEVISTPGRQDDLPQRL